MVIDGRSVGAAIFRGKLVQDSSVNTLRQYKKCIFRQKIHFWYIKSVFFVRKYTFDTLKVYSSSENTLLIQRWCIFWQFLHYRKIIFSEHELWTQKNNSNLWMNFIFLRSFRPDTTMTTANHAIGLLHEIFNRLASTPLTFCCNRSPLATAHLLLLPVAWAAPAAT
jgi:hypothetical protein